VRWQHRQKQKKEKSDVFNREYHTPIRWLPAKTQEKLISPRQFEALFFEKGGK